MHACVRVSEGYKGYTAMIKETYRDPWPRWFVVIGLSTSVMLVLECELSSTRHPLYRCRSICCRWVPSLRGLSPLISFCVAGTSLTKMA